MLFHRCFGIRILSPFHLNNLNIPIQNTKFPENAKNACPDIIFSPTIFWNLELCRLCMSMPKPICADRQCCPWIILLCAVLRAVIKAESEQRVWLFLLQSMKCASMCFTHDLSFISELIKLKPISGGVYSLFWAGLRVSSMQIGALSRTKVDEGTSSTNPEILSSWSLFSEMFDSSLSNEKITILQGV